MNDWLLAVLVLVGMLFLHDVWRLIRKAITAIDRDQQILDQIEGNDDDHITLEDLNIIAIDTTDMAKQDAVLAFIDAWEKHHEQSHD